MTIKMSPVLSDGVLLDDAVLEIKKTKASPSKQEEEVVQSKKASDSQGLHQRIKAAAVVDKEKVESFKQKISNKSFTINAQRIAEKMLAFENDLFPKPKSE